MFTPILILTAIGLFIAFAVAIIVRYFGMPEDPLKQQITDLMPGANCGGCGFAGCGAYATAMAEGKAKPGKCPSMSSENAAKIAELLGVTVEKSEPMVAIVCCSGDDNTASRNAFYNGVNNCRDAMQIDAGTKSCSYGCLGLGSCANACPFHAIEMTPQHLAVVHPELCTGCGKCVDTCPKNIIKLVPRSAKIHVFCSSPLRGAEKRKVCKSGCIGCQKCKKAAEEGQIEMNGSLAVINYENPPAAEIASQCPTHVLRSNETTPKKSKEETNE